MDDANKKLSEIIADSNAAGFNDIIGNTKNSKPKKVHVDKKDYFLEDMKDRLNSAKRAVEVFKKEVASGKSELDSINYLDNTGIFTKGTFENIKTKDEFNSWYKKTLTNLRTMIAQAKSNPERKRLSEELGALLGDFDRDAFKEKLDDIGKQIEKTLSESISKWDLYKKLYDATGNKGFASQLTYGNFTKNNNAIDAIKSDFSNNEFAKNKGVKFEDLIGMSDSEIKAKGLEPLTKFRDKYIEENNKIKSETIQNLSDLVQKNKDYAQKRVDIQIKLDKDLADIQANRTGLEKGGVVFFYIVS